MSPKMSVNSSRILRARCTEKTGKYSITSLIVKILWPVQVDHSRDAVDNLLNYLWQGHWALATSCLWNPHGHSLGHSYQCLMLVCIMLFLQFHHMTDLAQTLVVLQHALYLRICKSLHSFCNMNVDDGVVQFLHQMYYIQLLCNIL